MLVGAARQPGDTKPADAKPVTVPEKDDKKAADEEPVLSVTAHTIVVGGKEIKYHATAGYMVLKAEEGKDDAPPSGPGAKENADKKDSDTNKLKDNLKPKAKVFFTAYTLDDVADPATRPLTFAFNGGPGSSSVWLHMASFAPRRAALTPEGEAPPPPYKLADNESTWLDMTDLVFIDPVSTGYSRPMPKEDAKQFHGLKEDIASVGDFIRLYTSRNSRWLSPKIVLGESYGTTRAAGLSDYLQNRYGLYLNGIILVSSVLNFQTLEFSPQNIDPYVDFLPSYAVTAWYHNKLSPDMQAKSVEEVAAEARAFAGKDYALALLRGDAVSAEDKKRIAEQFNRFTGMSADYFTLLKLRMRDGIFFTELLKPQGRIVGRFDSRFTGLSYAPGEGRGDGYDPSDEAVSGPLTAAFNDYVRRELKFESDLSYETIGDVYPWNFGDAGNGFPNTAEDLRKAMTRNPYLKVWVTCSYYDLATPFFGAENVVASMNLDPPIRANMSFTYYPAGHMLYIHQPSREKFKKDFAVFLKECTSQPLVPAAARMAPAAKANS
ncbi:MAG: peptidase S10 [Planctomycetes bacterium]|nr:peptidase S10 [Planctomycetota bacterium]